MQIHPEHLSQLRTAIEKANARMRFSSPADKNVKLKGSECPNALLESVSDSAWHRLIHHTETLNDTELAVLNKSSLDYFDEFPYLVSPNRQLLMEQPSHSLLVSHVIRLFGIPPTQYKVIAKNGKLSAMEKMREAGFDVLPEPSIRTKLDGFPVFMSDRDGESRVGNYGALILSRAREGVIRNSFELAVAFLATGVLVRIAQSSIACKDSSQSDIN